MYLRCTHLFLRPIFIRFHQAKGTLYDLSQQKPLQEQVTFRGNLAHICTSVSAPPIRSRVAVSEQRPNRLRGRSEHGKERGPFPHHPTSSCVQGLGALGDENMRSCRLISTWCYSSAPGPHPEPYTATSPAGNT